MKRFAPSTNAVRASLLGLMLLSPSAARAVTDSDAKAQSLLEQMTLDEKIGQMTQADLLALTNKADVQKYFLGSMLSGGGSDPKDNSPDTWRKTVNELQEWALKTRLKIPLVYGVDAVHGHNNVDGAVVFPHQIGQGATRNPKLVEETAHVTAREIAGTGIHWAFAPCVAVAQNIHWGRTYESFSESPDLAAELGAAAVRGYQRPLPDGSTVLACAKHFAGDGGTTGGVDQGKTEGDEAMLRKLHLNPYLPSIKAGVGSIMVSYNSWNGPKMHAHKRLLTDVLKGEFGFKGFLISDWAAIDQLSPDYKTDIVQSINAGLDMVMIPNGPGQKNNYVEFITLLKELVAEGKVPQARVDDAVLRILRVKAEMGLFDHPFGSPSLAAAVGSPEHRQVARECVRQSVVLLKNDKSALPLSKQIRRLVVAGKAADDLGVQCGGWTIDWQGRSGAVTKGGTTILQAVKKTVGSSTEVTFSPDGGNTTGADAVLVVVGEQPYAEMKGDRADLRLPAQDLALIQKVKQAGVPVITVLLSGRPLVLGSALEDSNALLAAWLPGTEGLGVADVLFGDYRPTGKLPRTWPRSNDQLGLTINQPGPDKPQFPFGFGLTY